MPDKLNTRHPHLEMRPVTHQHKERLMQIAAQIWGGHDYLPLVFDRWVGDADAPFLGLFEDERLVGCGRMMPFDTRRVWMEALRVDPADQGKGWGREITRRMIRIAIGSGYRELYFSTYFRNTASIRITEQFGFGIIARYSFLLLDIDKPATDNSPAPHPTTMDAGADLVPPADSHGVEVRPGIPGVDDYLWNDWLFVPADAPGRERYFPQAETVRYRDCTLLVCENTKYSPGTLDIGWISYSDPASVKPCIDHARARARRENRRQLQLMLPEAVPIGAFRDLGFRSFERELDVYLFRALADQLEL